MPDIFVPMDTSIYYRYFNNLIRKNVLFPYVVGYVDKNRDQIKTSYKSFNEFSTGFKVNNEMLNDLVAAGEKDSIKRDDQSLKFSGPIISRQIKALIARDIYEPGDYYKIMVEDDQEIKKSLEILSDQKIYNSYLAK